MPPIWVLVADNSKASMYNFKPQKHELHLLDAILHEEGRWHNGDFISDKNGNATSNSLRGLANNGLGSTDKSPKHVESMRFTKMIAHAINHAYEERSFHSLQVCAPPRFMGELLPYLKKEIPVHTINKDLVSSNPEQIMSHLNPLMLD